MPAERSTSGRDTATRLPDMKGRAVFPVAASVPTVLPPDMKGRAEFPVAVSLPTVVRQDMRARAAFPVSALLPTVLPPDMGGRAAFPVAISRPTVLFPPVKSRTAFSVTASLFALLLGLLPAEVLACPSCTLRAPESTIRSVLLLGALVLTPFLLVGVGVWAARRAMREERL